MKKKIIAGVALVAIAIVAIVIIFSSNKVAWDYEIHVEEPFDEYQNFWLMNGFTSDQDGYYKEVFLIDRSLLYYYDPTNMSSGELVCTQANCKHKDENCKALFGEKTAEFQYCNGYIFYRELSDNMETWLYRCNTDGSNRTKLMLLGDPNEVYSIQHLYIHKNHVIVQQIMRDGKHMRLVDFDMEGIGKYGKGKTIATIPMDTGHNFLLDIKADRLLYQEIASNKSKVYEYDLTNGNSKLVYDSDAICCNVKIYQDGLLVSVDGRVIYINSQGEEKEVCTNKSGESAWISTDGRHIYVFDGQVVGDEVVTIYDEELQELCKLDCFREKEGAMIVPCYFSDGKNLIFTRGDLKKMWMCKVEDLIKGKVDLHTVFFR